MTRTDFRLRNSNGFRFLQVKVGRVGLIHEIALSLAHELKADFIATQELWYKDSANLPLTKSQTVFRTFLPRPDNNARPRAASYLRKVSHIRTTMTYNGKSKDFCFFHLRFKDNWTLNIWNVHNASVGS